MLLVRTLLATRAAGDSPTILFSDARVSSIVGLGMFLIPLVLRLRSICLFEYFRERPLLVRFSVSVSGVGSGCERFLAARISGKTSSRSLRFSSDMRTRSSLRDRISSSLSLIMVIIRVISSWVGGAESLADSAARNC